MNSLNFGRSVEQALNKANLEVIDKPTPFLFGEDFWFYGQQLAPAYFVFVGTQNKAKRLYYRFAYLSFKFDEKILIDVANYYEQLLRNYKEV